MSVCQSVCISSPLQCYLKLGDTEAAVEWLNKAKTVPTVTTEVSWMYSLTASVVKARPPTTTHISHVQYFPSFQDETSQEEIVSLLEQYGQTE